MNTVEFIKNKLRNHKIVCICKTGSTTYCKNPRDTDYFVLVEDLDTDYVSYHDKDTHTDYFCYLKSYWIKLLSLEIITKHSINIFFQKMNELEENVVYGENTIKWDIFGKEARYKQMLKELCKDNILNPIVESKRGSPLKTTVLAFIPLFFLENKNYELTNEQRKIIQQAHDLELEWKWNDWIKDILLNIENK